MMNRLSQVSSLKENQPRIRLLTDVIFSESPEFVRSFYQEISHALRAGLLDQETALLILSEPNKAEFTPLMQALKNEKMNDLLDRYFEDLWFALTLDIRGASFNLNQYTVCLKLYFAYLIKPNYSGFTPLFQVLVSANHDNFKRYLNQLKCILEQESSLAKKYFTLLLKKNQAGFTPLLQAIKSGNPPNLEIYLNEVDDGFQCNLITGQDYFNLLIQSNHDGFSPFEEALQAKNALISQIYFQTLQKVLQLIPKLDIRKFLDLLTEPNQKGYTVLHQALKSGNTDGMRTYIQYIQYYINNGSINAQNLCRILTLANQAGYTPFKEAILGNNIANLKLYFNLIKYALKLKFLSLNACLDFLTDPSHLEKSPGLIFTHTNQDINIEVKAFIENIRTRLVRDQTIAVNTQGTHPVFFKTNITHYSQMNHSVTEKRGRLTPPLSAYGDQSFFATAGNSSNDLDKIMPYWSIKRQG